MNGESKVFTKMKFFMGKSGLFLALAFAITVYHFHDSDFLHPAGFSRVITVHGEQEENGIEANGQAESTRTPTGDATVDYAAHVNVNTASADMNSNWNITESHKRLSSYDGRPRRFESIVRSVSNRHGVDPDLVWAVMKAESNFNPHARSRKGAGGLMQLMPGTARQHKVADIYNPAENINGGVRHLQLLLNRFRGDVRLAVAAYNAGARTVDRYKDIPPYSETRRYVLRVLAYYQLYSGRGENPDGDVRR